MDDGQMMQACKDHWQEVEAIALAELRRRPIAGRVLLYGPPGTGKTWWGCRADLRGRRLFKFTVTRETSMAEARGHYILGENGQYRFHYGPCTAGWMEGGRVVVDEITEGGGDLHYFFHAWLDDPEVAQYTLPTLDVVRPAPGFSCVATTNELNPKEILSSGLADRLTVQVKVELPHPDGLLRVNPEYRAMLLQTIQQRDGRWAGLRSWVAFSELEPTLGRPLAAKAVFGERAGELLKAMNLEQGTTVTPTPTVLAEAAQMLVKFVERTRQPVGRR